MEYISKSAVVAEIEKRKKKNFINEGAFEEDIDILSFLDTLEVRHKDTEHVSLELNESEDEKQGEQKHIDKLNIINFIRQETGCGLAEADNALSKLINVLKERPHLILDKPHELTIKWNQNMNNFIHCPECKSNFHFADSDIIEDSWVICPDCKNEICLLQ